MGSAEPDWTREDREAWAIAIADALLEVRDARTREGRDPSLPLDDCWIGHDLALYVRYRGGASRRAARWADLHLNVLNPTWAVGSVHRQAADIFDDLHGWVPPRYTDQLGYDWWGDDPADWEQAVHEQGRVHTAWPPPCEQADWASAVAVALVVVATKAHATFPHDPVLTDCWVGEDLAVYARYRYDGAERGHRSARLGRDERAPEFVHSPRDIAVQLWHEFGVGAATDHVDSSGRSWTGDPPAPPSTWAYAVEQMPRAFTALAGA